MAIKFTPLNTGGSGGGNVNVTIPKLKAVPNVGPIKNIFFNTDLSEEEIGTLIKNLNYIDTGEGVKAYCIAYIFINDPDSPTSMDITIMDFSDMFGENAFGILVMGEIPIYMSQTLAINMAGDASQAGWAKYEEVLEFVTMLSMMEDMANAEGMDMSFISENEEGLPIGQDNALITNLVNCGTEEGDTSIELSGDYTGIKLRLNKQEETDLTTYFEQKQIPTSVIVSILMQNKNVDPSLEDQTITCDEGYEGLKSVTINAAKENMFLRDYTISSSAGTTIPSEMYSGLDIFKSIEIPSNVETIGHGILTGCKSLEKITLPFAGYDATGTNPELCHLFGAPMGIPNIEDQKATYLPPNLKEIILTNPKIIYTNAFYKCSNLEKITLYNSNIPYIDSNAFYGCKNLKEVHITDLVAWCNMTKNSALGNENRALYVNGNIIDSNLTIPEGVTKIGPGSFNSQANIENVTISEGVIEIGTGAFGNCINLKTVTLPESLVKIGWDVFNGTKISKIIIPSNVDSIGGSAFANCDSLATLIIENTDEVVTLGANNAFGESALMMDGTGIVYVPDSMVSSYKNNIIWQKALLNYDTQIKPKSEYVE